MRVEDRLRVSVVAAGSVAAQDAPTSDIDGVEPWALLRGLIDDFEIAQDGRQHGAVDVLAAQLTASTVPQPRREAARKCGTSHRPRPPADRRP